MLSFEIEYKLLVQWDFCFVGLSFGILKGAKGIYEDFHHEDFHQQSWHHRSG